MISHQPSAISHQPSAISHQPSAVYPAARQSQKIADVCSSFDSGAGIPANDLVRGMTAARRIRCGAVHVGMHSFQSDAMAPVGGIGMSGFGRSGGHYSVEHFTELKWISLELGETAGPF